MIRLLKRFYNWGDLVFALALTSIKHRYKQGYLRIAWAVINPIFTLLILSLVFSRVARLPSEGMPYLVFCFTALVPWNLFSAAMGFSAQSLSINYNLITRMNFPRTTIPLAAILATFLDFVIAFILLIMLIIMFGIKINMMVLLIIPVIAVQTLFMIGVGLTLSVLNVYLRDIQSALPLILQAWMLISPVGYSIDMVGGKLKFFYLLNPMAGILDSYRKVLLHNSFPDPYYFMMSLVISGGIFVLGYWFFKKNEKKLADIVSP
jgi:lipopolysaccharide transport system permease protein